MNFTYLVLAKGMAKKTGGGFSGTGDWMILKCFLEEIQAYGEFFINLNLRSGEGEIACKDTAYSLDLIAAFSKEMRGEA